MADVQTELEPHPNAAEAEDRDAVVAVVGIGVCAASLQSLETLLADIAPTLGAAYLIAVRQQEGLDVGTVIEVLQRRSPLPVSIGRHEEKIEPDHIYVGGPEDMIRIEDGHLSVTPADKPVGQRGTIDSMLISVAEHGQDRSVAVLLGGLGTDGTAGVTATKTFGGLSIGEANTVDDANGARGVAGPFGVVDLHVPIDRIGAEIAKYLGSLTHAADDRQRSPRPEEVEAHVTQITGILRKVISHDFHGYKRGTFLRRVHRRMLVLQIETLAEYVERLRGDRQEVQDLFQDLLIGVTHFFRDPAEFEVLERELPRLFESKDASDQFRVWVIGCATGEEAYSMAILLREHMATMDHPPHVQIFATDLDARALGLARVGRYAASIEAHIRPDRLERWFKREGDTYCVSKELREMCIFSPHNLLKDAPFSRIDVLSCRNLLIYLNTELQNRVVPIFHFSLRPAGTLFLGNSENITRHQKLFAPVDRGKRVFRRLETATRIVPDLPLTPRPRPTADEIVLIDSPPPPRVPGPVGRQAQAIADRYAPAYVVIDTQGDVLHFSGRMGRFLEPAAGVASLSLMNLVHRDLRSDLRAAVARAVAERGRVELPRLVLHDGAGVTGISLIVEPVGTDDVSALVVLFQDAGPLADAPAGSARANADEHVERLESELRMARDRLQATVEELESTNEELKSSNEEYQSINEELQSANEEMETSKEELQSVNEELQTVNGELAHRVTDLGRSNSDLKNLLEATQIATLFLDNDLRVRSYTPSAVDIFHLHEGDVGRPIDHVVSRVAYPNLAQDVRRVLKTLVPIECTVVEPTTDRLFAAKVLPYRSIDNYISGAVVTFTDLTATHEAERALRDSEARMRALLSVSSQVVYRMNADWTEMMALSGGDFLADTQQSAGWMAQHIPVDEQPRVQAEIDRAVAARDVFEMEHRVRRVDGSIGWTFSRAVPITDADGRITEWFGAAGDITARREAEEALRGSEERLKSLVEGLTPLAWRASDIAFWSWASRQWQEYTGQSEAESEGRGWMGTLHPDDRAIALAAWDRAIEQDGFEAEWRICRASDGAYRWFQTRTTPVRDEAGAIVEWIGTSTDVNDLRDLQERQGVLVAELQHRTRNLIGVVRQVAQKTARGSSDLDAFRDRFRDRLDALARVQGLLSRLNEHDRVTFDELVRTELSAHGAEPDEDGRVVIDGPDGVRLRSTTVQTLAMALHELATNAVKYGALGQPDARLAVTWHLSPEEGSDQAWLHVDWRETGVVMPTADAPGGSGQGRELIERALPYQLAARTTYVLADDGVRCTIAMPVSASKA